MDCHSTLELAKHDETARAPERDWDATAFELDGSALAPQVVLDTTPQVSYDSSLPEVHNIEKSGEEEAPSPHTPKLAFKRSLMIAVLVISVAVAVGVGVGISRHRKNAPQGSSTINSPPAPRPTTPNATQYILNDTSLAALVLPDGDRQLFFQDNNGSIRRAIRTASDNQWTISPYLNLTSNPKRHTPLAATVYNEVEMINGMIRDEGLDPITIGLQYVSDNHVLISDHSMQAYWHPDVSFGNWSTAVDTRSLSFCSLSLPSGTEILNGTNSIINLALLIYESPTRKVSALLWRGNTSTYGSAPNEWVDITSQESKALPDAFRNPDDSTSSLAFTSSFTLYEANTSATLSTPFICEANYSSYEVELLFYSPDAGSAILNPTYSANSGSPSSPGAFSSLFEFFHSSLDYNYIHQSDIATFGTLYFIWINGTQPVAGTADSVTNPGTPKTSFPFARLASVTSQSTTYLYHQMNGTTFAEERWNDQEQLWLVTEYIYVSDL